MGVGSKKGEKEIREKPAVKAKAGDFREGHDDPPV